MDQHKDDGSERHHLVPAFYLRRFSNDKAQIKVVSRDLKHSFVTSITKAASEVDFYATQTADGKTSRDVERLLSQVETVAARVIADILDRGSFPPSEGDRVHLAIFLATQFTRGRDKRHAGEMMTDYASKRLFQGLTDENIRERLSHTHGRPATDE